MAEPHRGEVLVLPPVPLATGRFLRAGDDRLLPVVAVEVVVATADGGRHAIPLVERHGAWWPPDR